jgi:hypothetical protein
MGNSPAAIQGRPNSINQLQALMYGCNSPQHALNQANHALKRLRTYHMAHTEIPTELTTFRSCMSISTRT